jgi:integrase
VRDAITLAIDTGLRLSELFGLQWPQIDFARGIIATTTKTKSGRARHVPLTQRSRLILNAIPRRLDTRYVLVNPDTGTRYVHRSKGLEAARRRSGTAAVRWHDLRRTAGCRWLQCDGKTIHDVSVLLGHSSVSVTEKHYAFVNEQALAESLGGTKTGTDHKVAR